VIVAMPSAHHQKRKQAIDLATQLNLEVMTVPAIDDLMSGKVSVSQIRKVDVEDLLGRDAVKLDSSGLQMLIDHQTVLVSGAGGSIGSELCRQIVKYRPDTLICLDISEFSLYQLEQELTGMNLETKLVYFTCDVKNKVRINHILEQYQPSVVFHAAAYKHVPMMENGNVWEALSNNVIGTHTLAQACKSNGVSKFVLISTDKAVNPTNVMGASKRLAEMVCQGLQSDNGTRFVIVRFGNVLGSSGSVIPKFREQIAKGGPITITHPEITRYFMSIPEAAQLVMQAGLMGKGGEIFVLDMGEPVKIADLAADMVRLSGFSTDEIKIEYVGLRPGEKLYEELLADDEHTMPTPHEKLRIAQARTADISWVNSLLLWIEGLHGTHETQMKLELSSWVEEYSPQILNVTDGHGQSLSQQHITLH
jgi:FlaA1/EpsC-like NDP-sugar epimerase